MDHRVKSVPHASENPSPIVWITLCMLVVTLCIARVSTTRVDDDNMWLAYAASPASPDAKAMEQTFVAQVVLQHGCEVSAYRLALRERYAGTYAGYSAVQRAIHAVWTEFSPAGITSILGASLLAKLLVSLTLAVALVLIIARTRDPLMTTVFVGALAALVVGEIATRWLGNYWVVDVGQPVNAIAKLAYGFVVPLEAHALFGTTPRNAALDLFAAALLLRWQGSHIAAALVILSIGLAHQTYAGLALVLFSLATAVSRPAVLGSWSVRTILVAATITYVMRERYFGGAHLVVQLAVVAALISSAVAALALVASPRYSRLRTRALGAAAGRESFLDAGVCILFAGIVTIVCLVGGSWDSDPITRDYFWSDLATRIWSFVRFPAFVALALLVLSHIRIAEGPRNATLAVAAVVLCILAFVQIDRAAPVRQLREFASLISVLPATTELMPISEEDRLYANLALVATGAESASVAWTRFMAGRRIVCQ